jgi:very-short-patch-repair endonuclease
VDFYCHEVRLVVEVDGDTHELRQQQDTERTRYLQSHGLNVFRMQNDDVYSDLESVALGILRAAGIDVQTWLAERERMPHEHSAPSP